MMNSTTQLAVREKLILELGSAYKALQFRNHGSGCINQTFEGYAPGSDSVFIKAGPASSLDMYQKEVLGLDLLRQCSAIRVPQVIFVAHCGDAAILALEFIELSRVGRYGTRFGEALAAMHQIRQSQFGLDHDNFIGRSAQHNLPRSAEAAKKWWPFFCENRLQVQLRMAASNGLPKASAAKLEKLISLIPLKLAGHEPSPCLLHGDLWSGNLAVDESGWPTLFDPAVYYGDPETDIAMSKMFGALEPEAYQAYDQLIEPKDGREPRRKLYDLYHWLNHFNLFGGSYLRQAEVTLDQLLYAMDAK